MLERKCDRCGRVIEDDYKTYTVTVTRAKGTSTLTESDIMEKDLCKHCVDQLYKFWESSPTRRWTDEEIKQLFSYRKAGLTETQIMAKMDRSKQAIHCALYNKACQERAEKLLKGDEQE